MCCLRWRILHVNRALSSVGRGWLSATFSRPIPIYFSDELPVQFVFLHLGLGLKWFVLGFFAFKKIFTFLLFKARSLDERGKFAGQDAHKVCEDSRVKKRSPLPKGKHKTRTPPSREGQRLSRKYHPLFPLQELGWRLWSRSMT